MVLYLFELNETIQFWIKHLIVELFEERVMSIGKVMWLGTVELFSLGFRENAGQVYNPQSIPKVKHVIIKVIAEIELQSDRIPFKILTKMWKSLEIGQFFWVYKCYNQYFNSELIYI